MDLNLKALGAETVMVDRRLAARLVEAELLLRDGEKLPYAEELNQFIRQNSFIGVILQSVYSLNVPSPEKMLNALE